MAQEMAMLHDIARCSACRACMVACKQWHNLPADMSTPFEGQYQSHKTLTPSTWTLIRMDERVDAKKKFHWDFVKTQCMHCGDPACAKGCPEEAISKLDSGAVVVDPDKCVGCAYCVHNCPFDVPRINAETHKMQKCDLCFDRIEEGMTPSCAKTCTSDALQFGPYEEIEQIARDRVEELKAAGNEDANVYNPQGVGGVHMIYVLPEKPEVYGFDPKANTPTSIDVWKDVVRPAGKVVIAAAAVGAVGLTALHKLKGKDSDGNGGEH